MRQESPERDRDEADQEAGDPDAAEACMAATVERFGQVDILVNNAATNPYHGPLMGLDVARAAKTVQVNLIGPLVWTQAAWRAGMESHGGVVVNIASVGGLRPGTSSISWYGATKAGLIHLTQTLANELGPKVRVNAIAVGAVETSALAPFLNDELRGKMESLTPMRRIGTVEDIALAALYLASPASSWVTGKIFEVDGGTEATNWPFEGPTI